MYEYMYIYLGDYEIYTYALLMAVGTVLALLGGVLLGKRQGLKPAGLLLYGVLSTVLGLLVGRVIYCAVRWDMVFLDAMGEFGGLGSFFDLSVGSVNVMGIVAGLLLAAPIAAAVTKVKAAAYLDAAVVPALVMYCFARAVEPLSGQGYGDLMGMMVYACWIEAVLTILVLVAVLLLRRKVRCPGTLAQYALVLWCVTQILPESLRCDEALYVFVFARVTHLGLATTLGLTLIRLLVLEGKKGLPAKAIVLDVLGLAFGIGLCIATIFALDKTNLPKLLVYAGMVLSLVELAVVVCRRIRLTDKA